MKKKILASVLTITMFTAIVGCGSGKTTEVPAEKTTTEAVKAEEVTTEAPEVATTEAEPQMATEKVEVLIDPTTYEWGDDEKIIYNDGNSEYEFYKDIGAYGDDFTVTYNDPQRSLRRYFYGKSLETVNTFVKFVYECSYITEGFDGTNAIIGYYNEDNVEEIRPWNENVSITYIKGSFSYCFYSQGDEKESVGYLKKVDSNGKIYWDYPLSPKMRDIVAKFISINEELKASFKS